MRSTDFIVVREYVEVYDVIEYKPGDVLRLISDLRRLKQAAEAGEDWAAKRESWIERLDCSSNYSARVVSVEGDLVNVVSLVSWAPKISDTLPLSRLRQPRRVLQFTATFKSKSRNTWVSTAGTIEELAKNIVNTFGVRAMSVHEWVMLGVSIGNAPYA